jgi:hypothetical protein
MTSPFEVAVSLQLSVEIGQLWHGDRDHPPVTIQVAYGEPSHHELVGHPVVGEELA